RRWRTRRARATRRSGRAALRGASTAGRLVNALGRRRVLRKLVGGPARPRHQLAAAARTPAAEHRRRARPAEPALERPDHDVGRVRREIAVTAFTARTQLEHFSPPFDYFTPACTALR